MPAGVSTVVQGQQDSKQPAQRHATLSSSSMALGLCYSQAAACCHLQHQSKDEMLAVTCSMQQLQAVLQASKQGKLTGAAASSLGLVLRTALQIRAAHSESAQSDSTNPDSAQPAQKQPSSHHTESRQSALQGSNLHQAGSEGDEAIVREAMVQLCEAGQQVAKLPSAAVAKQGVALGLASLLGVASTMTATESGYGPHSLTWRDQAKHALKVSRLSACSTPVIAGNSFVWHPLLQAATSAV